MAAKLPPRAGVLDIVIEQGATFNPLLTWRDSEQTPIDLSGYTARLQVRKFYNSPSVILELTTENGGITLGGSAGTIQLYMSDTDTSQLALLNGVYDLEVESATGIVYRVLQGSVLVSQEVTR